MTSGVRSLPPLPSSIRTLTDPEVDRLRLEYSSLWADPHQSCPVCDKNEIIKVLVGEGVVEYRCDCVEQWRLNRFLLHCGLGERHQQMRWDEVSSQMPDEALEPVVTYSENARDYFRAGMGVILHGANGVGKTLLATLLLKNLIGLGHESYFTQFNLLIDSYTATWRDVDEQRWFNRRIRHAEVLLIDDIGKENKGLERVTGSMFDQVIRSRVAHNMPTIITTNLSPEEMRSGYGGSVMSLLAEVSISVEVTGSDYRGTFSQISQRGIKQGLVRPFTLGHL